MRMHVSAAEHVTVLFLDDRGVRWPPRSYFSFFPPIPGKKVLSEVDKLFG